MKSLKFFLLGMLFLCSCSSDSEVVSLEGTLTGSVSDKSTGEPVPTVIVALNPGGQTTVTGSDGSFNFPRLDAGTYTVNLTKEGYNPTSGRFTVKEGQVTTAHLLIERIPSTLTCDRDVLDFGESASVTTMSFAIVNSGYTDLAFKVETGDCKWLSVDPDADILAYGKTATLVVTIDRSLLASGENEAVIVVRSTSGDGNVEVKVRAVGEYRADAAVNTTDASDVTSTSATLNGEITNEGAPKYTERGFVYNFSTTPTVDNTVQKITAPMTASNVFSAAVGELEPLQTVHVRAYCVQNGNVIYGNTISFRTIGETSVVYTSAATDVTSNSAMLHASVSESGIPEYTQRGFCYGESVDPTIQDDKVIVDGSGTGDYSVLISGLKYQATYYVRAYVMQSGEPVYGNTISFTTRFGLPSVTTSAATSITSTTAILHANITDAGDPEYTERGFCYSKNSEPDIQDTKVKVSGAGAGEYSATIENLSYPETYYVRAYVIQDGDTVYGNVVSFETLFIESGVTTSTVTNISYDEAQLNGIINEAGSPEYSYRGFCYSKTNSNPTISDNKTTDYTVRTGSFRTTISDLEEGTTYYVRAYVVQDSATIYGDVVEFATHIQPSVRTRSVSNLTKEDLGGGFFYTWSVEFNGTVVSSGNPEYTKRGFVYDTNSTPTVGSGTNVSASGSGAGDYSATVSNLSDMQTYYVRAYVKTSEGYVYGDAVQFSTY